MKLSECIISLCIFCLKMNESLDPHQFLCIMDFSHSEGKYFKIEYLDNLSFIDFDFY